MKPFKTCSGCGKIWQTQEAFLTLEDLSPRGFQAHFLDGTKSVLLFHHEDPNCRTTITVPVVAFVNLMPGFFKAPLAFLTEECRRLCLIGNDLRPCDHPFCRNTMVRGFLQELINKKNKMIQKKKNT